MNKVILIGNLTRDPELRTTQSGTSVCSFTVAVRRDYTNANGEREADFINIQTWRTTAENCAKYLKKGSRVGVCGKLQITVTDGKDGGKKQYTDVIAENVEFLSDKKSDEAAEKPAQPVQTRMGELTPAEDDLPF